MDPLILLHGFDFHGVIFHSLERRLSANFQVIVVDLPGFGKSLPLSVPYTFDNIIGFIFERCPAPAIWVGWSFGGLVALWAALHYPELVKKVVTLATSLKFIETSGWPGISEREFEKFSGDLHNDYSVTLQRFLSLQCFQSQNGKSIFKTLKRDSALYSSPYPAALLGTLKLLKESDFRSQLSEIGCPVLQIYGEKDTLVPFAATEVLLTKVPKTMPVEFNVIVGASHIPFLSHEDQVVTLLQDFLLAETMQFCSSSFYCESESFPQADHVIPAQAGIQKRGLILDASLRWHDKLAI